MNLINSLSPTQILHSAIQAANLVQRHLWRWALLGLLCLILLETCGLIPYLGFTLKIALASIVTAQFISMLTPSAAMQQPSPAGLLKITAMPWTAWALLALSGMTCFGIGLLIMGLSLNWQSLAFFFSRPGQYPAPSQPAWLVFKLAMSISGLFFFFLPVNVRLKKLSPLQSLLLSVRGIWHNKLLALLMLSLIAGIELLNLLLLKFVGKPALLLSALLALYLLVWSAAMRLTSARQIFIGNTY